MVLNIIHRKERTDRQAHIEAEMLRQGMKLVVWHDAVTDCKTRHESIGESHKNVIRFAQKRGLERVCVAEDDVYFPAEDGWRYFLRMIPTQFDIFLGGVYTCRMTIDQYAFHKVTLDRWSGMHLYVVHNRFYNVFLQADVVNYNIERAVQKAAVENKRIVNLCWPYAAVQAETPSDNIKGKIYPIKDFFNQYNTYGL